MWITIGYYHSFRSSASGSFHLYWNVFKCLHGWLFDKSYCVLSVENRICKWSDIPRKYDRGDNYWTHSLHIYISWFDSNSLNPWRFDDSGNWKSVPIISKCSMTLGLQLLPQHMVGRGPLCTFFLNPQADLHCSFTVPPTITLTNPTITSVLNNSFPSANKIEYWHV